jgi:UDP-N-acetylglucosamine 2-epimerase
MNIDSVKYIENIYGDGKAAEKIMSIIYKSKM